MAEHYIEEYLVSLGFDLDSDTGKEYRKMLDDLEKKQKDFDKGNASADKKRQDDAKKRVTDTKKENDSLVDVQKTMQQIAALSAELGEGNVFGSLLAGASTVKTLQSFLENLGESLEKTDAKGGKFGQTISSIFNKPKKASGYAESKEAAKGAQAGAAEAKGIQAGITGETAGAAEGMGASGALGGAAAAVLPVAIAAAAIAATIAIGKAISDLTNGLAETAIDIETMSKKMWITDSAAWKLNNTLTAMGKTTADLNEIALNSTLRQQFNDLQKFQAENLKLPADFEETAKEWAIGVGESSEKLNAANTYMKQIASYDLQKAFEPFVATWYEFWTGIALDIGKVGEPIGKAIDKIKDFLLSIGVLEQDKNVSVATANASTTGLINGATYAPQMSSYTTANTGNLTIQNTPTVNVYPTSGDPQSIGSAAADAVGASLDDVALIKSVQGMSR